MISSGSHPPQPVMVEGEAGGRAGARSFRALHVTQPVNSRDSHGPLCPEASHPAVLLF